MNKKKTQTTQQQTNTNTYGQITPQDTADIQKLRDFKFTADPSIGYAYGSAKNQIANSFNNPIGGNYAPQQRDAILRNSFADLAQRESQAKSEAAQQLQGAQYGQLAGIASMTAPRIVQTGGSSTGTGTTTTSGGLLGDLLTSAAGGAAGGLAAGATGGGSTGAAA